MSIEFSWCNSVQGEAFPARAYHELLARLPDSSPYNRVPWLAGAECSLPGGQRVEVLLGYSQQQLVLCLPLLVCQEKQLGLPITVVRLLGYPLADRMVLPVCGEQAGLLSKALGEIRARIRFASIQFSEVTEQEAQRSGLTGWQRQFWYSESRISCAAPVHEVTEADRHEPPGKVKYKYELRRARKHADQLGATVERVVPDADTIDALMDAIIEVEQASWKGEEGVGVFSGAERQQWMRSAFRGLASSGHVRVVQMLHEGRCISYRLGLLDEQGRLYDFNVAFVPEHARLGSGRLLLDEWIRWGLDEGWRWVDASRVSLRDSNHQLHERLSGFVEHRRWTFYNRTAAGLLTGLAYRLWQEAKPRVYAWRARRKAAAAPKQQDNTGTQV